MLLAVVAGGEGILTPSNCWNNREKFAPAVKLSDLGEVRFVQYARVAELDEMLEARLEQVRGKMQFSSVPENVSLRKEKIPATLVEAGNYLDRNVCMAWPPTMCVEAEDGFFFSGGGTTGPVYDFDSGMAVMKEDGSIWVWDGGDGGGPGSADGPSAPPARRGGPPHPPFAGAPVEWVVGEWPEGTQGGVWQYSHLSPRGDIPPPGGGLGAEFGRGAIMFEKRAR